jgi:hypothetical protein
VPLYRHLPLAHHFEQGGLCAWRRTVDLIGEDDIGKDGTGTKLKNPFLWLVKTASGDVGREEIGGELNTAKTPRERLRKGFCQSGLTRPRHVL